MDIEQKLSDLEDGLDELRAEIEAGKVGGKVLIMGHHTVPDGVYPVMQRKGACYTIKHEGMYTLASNLCDVFQRLLSGPFDSARIPKNQIHGYMVWDSHYGEWREVMSVGSGSGSVKLESKGDHHRWGFRRDGHFGDDTELHFQPPEVAEIPEPPKHTYKIGDCFERSDGSIHRLSKGGSKQHGQHGVLVNLEQKCLHWENNYLLGDDDTVLNQDAFSEYLENCNLTYIGTHAEVFVRKDKIVDLVKTWSEYAGDKKSLSYGERVTFSRCTNKLRKVLDQKADQGGE